MLLSDLTDCAERILSDTDMHMHYVEMLRFCPESFVISNLSFYWHSFCALLLRCCVSSQIKWVRVTKPKMMTEFSLDEEENEVIYYIASSIMRGYLRIAYRYQNSNKWKCIMNNIKKRILTDQPVGYSNWLLSVDRGGLYVTRECQDLFVGVAKIVYASEKRDGSIAMAMSLKQ